MSNRVEIKEIKLKRQNYNYQTRQHTLEVKDEYCIKYSDIDKFNKWVKRISTKNTIPEGKTVYFHPAVVFPRRKFGKSYPKNKLVTDISKAEVIVIDSGKLQEYGFPGIIVPLKDSSYCNEYYSSNFSTDIDTSRANLEITSYNNKELACTARDRMNLMYEFSDNGGVYVDVKNVFVKSDSPSISEEAFDRINKMLASDDANMRNMGVRMLTGYDYTENKHKIVMLMHLNNAKWMSGKRSNSVEIKTLLQKLDADFPSYRWASSEKELSFWLGMLAKYPDENTVQIAVNSWIRKMVPDFGCTLRMTIIPDNETNNKTAGMGDKT